MISFDAFLVFNEIAATGEIERDELVTACASRGLLDIDLQVDELARADLVDVVGTRIAIKLTKLNKRSKQPSCSKRSKANCTKRSQLTKTNTTYLKSSLSSLSVDSCRNQTKADVGSLIKLATKSASPAYRAVVDGRTPSRRDRAIEIFVERMSPLDRPRFLQAYESMTDEQQARIRQRLARLDSAGWRD